jgi:hypothetical protein
LGAKEVLKLPLLLECALRVVALTGESSRNLVIEQPPSIANGEQTARIQKHGPVVTGLVDESRKFIGLEFTRIVRERFQSLPNPGPSIWETRNKSIPDISALVTAKRGFPVTYKISG